MRDQITMWMCTPKVHLSRNMGGLGMTCLTQQSVPSFSLKTQVLKAGGSQIRSQSNLALKTKSPSSCLEIALRNNSMKGMALLEGWSPSLPVASPRADASTVSCGFQIVKAHPGRGRGRMSLLQILSCLWGSCVFLGRY